MANKKKTKKAQKAVEKASKRLTRAGGEQAVIALAKEKAFTDQAPEKAFEHFRPLAEKMPAGDLPGFNGQALLLRANIMTALEALEPHLPKAVSQLRDAKLHEVFELPSLAMALDFASSRVPVAKLSAGDIEKMLNEGSPWRELLLSYLEVASHPLLGLLPRERVAAVRAGTGKLDKAKDFVALAGLFAEFSQALEGKHPFPAEALDRLATLGGALVQQIKPGKAPTQTTRRTPESILRDQLAQLIADRYDHLQVLATVALGKRKADELLPALRSATASGPSPSADAPPAKGDGAPAVASG